MATDRVVLFELHIRPLMRLIDRDNMLPVGIDLWDYDAVRERSGDILMHLRADMPPNRFGGPWPEEWIALFERWADTGFQRLQLGQVTAAGYKAVQTGSTVTVTGTSQAPGPGHQAWLEGGVGANGARELTHYLQPPPVAQPGAPAILRLKAVYESPTALTEIVLTDGAGRQVVPIQA